MGQYRRFKPVRVTTFPARKKKKANETKSHRLKRVFSVANFICTVLKHKGRTIRKIFTNKFSGKIQSVGPTTSEAMQR